MHPLLGAHVRLPEEPERHAWQADVGTAALPWLGDHQIHNVAALPGAAYCEMALAAARTVLGEGSEVRDVRFEQMLLLDDKTPVFAVASVTSPGVVDFVVETFQEGERVRRAAAVLHAGDGQDQPPAYDMAALLAAHPFDLDGAKCRQWFDDRGVHHGPAFPGLDGRARRRRHGQHGAGRSRAAWFDPLTTERLWDSPRPAGCLLPVRCGPPRRPGAAAICCCRWAYDGYAPTRRPATPATAIRR